MSPADEQIMNGEVDDKDFEQVSHLPYKKLLGTVSYPASCVKPELRYAVPICGRHRSKWGVWQWNAHLDRKLFAILVLDVIALVVNVVVLPFPALALPTAVAAAPTAMWLPLYGAALQPQVAI